MSRIDTSKGQAGQRTEGRAGLDERYRLMVDAITDYAIYMLDPTGVVSSWNAGAQRFKGYAADEIIGQNYSRFYQAADRAAGVPQRNLDFAAAHGRFEAEGWRVRKDGTCFWAWVVIDPIRTPEGELLGFAKVTRDLTERRAAQQALEQAREGLLQEQKLRALGQLTGGVAHDFNNLLAAILGSLELVRKRLPADAAGLVRLVDNAIKGAERGAALTQRMLAFARRQSLRFGPVALDALVAGMDDLLARSIGPDAVLQVAIPVGLPPVHTDANQLEMAILNLVLNARDAMPDGGRVTIAANQGPGEVTLIVSDTGQGMDDETLARAAEPFFTTKGVGQGTGLGLSMVHGLAQQSGGRLDIRSQPGQGTEVRVALPIAREAPSPSDPAGRIVAEGTDLPSLRVLVVDDDPLVRVQAAAMLEDLGHAVLLADGAEEALNLAQGNTVDLVLSDVAMPRLTGVQMAQVLRVLRPGLPIVLMTGYAEVDPADGPRSTARLAKPFTLAELKAALAAGVAAGGGAT
ncbi:ATP-binding protein [Zavarzinia sp. CC-PAN008]|uniref:PAS domain-containing sensor histidine kinase n=1 Tax=Zavarzinia sp. CC-PAN008 TaxID=3243332 RepID=UPI003F7488AA